MQEHFDFHGLTIEVGSTDAGLVDEVRRDFAYFRAAGGTPRVRVEMHSSPPPYDDLPSLRPAFLTPRNICYRDGRTTYIDYFGGALAVLDRDARRCDVYSADHDLLHEVVYLFILSTVGQHLDALGIHRIHALGMAYRDLAFLLLLPSGGGKSTMAIELLRESELRLLGEDTPLVDRQGYVLPFPLRLGIRPGQANGVPERYLRTVRRMEFDPKTLIDIEWVADRIGTRAKPSFIFVGERNLGQVSEIAPLPRHQAVRALMKYMVVGLGIYQGMEFLLERGVSEVLGKGGVAASRLYNGIRLLGNASAHRFVLGRSPELNRTTLLEFLRRRAAGSGR